jgi:maltooligosyltrehalose trehalohydrolase
MPRPSSIQIDIRPWGAAIRSRRTGRHIGCSEFFIENALYWLEEYRFDGLSASMPSTAYLIRQPARPPRGACAARADRPGPGAADPSDTGERSQPRVPLCERTPAGRPRQFTAQWNDDLHHALHGLLTDETDGRLSGLRDSTHRAYSSNRPYRPRPDPRLRVPGRAVSRFRGGRRRGSESAHLPPAAMVNFLQNHDQAGNRAFGERLHHLIAPEALDAAFALDLTCPLPATPVHGRGVRR